MKVKKKTFKNDLKFLKNSKLILENYSFQRGS